MITNFSVKNFKSIKHLELDLGRVNVFIGANGSGKSNILEAFAFLSSLENDKIYNEKLISKGVRIAKPSLTASAFAGSKEDYKLEFSLTTDSNKDDKSIADQFTFIPEQNDKVNSIWVDANPLELLAPDELDDNKLEDSKLSYTELQKKMQYLYTKSQRRMKKIRLFANLSTFVIYQPNAPALRGMTNESHKEPLGIFGENLDVLIANFSKEEQKNLDKYKNLVLWLADFFIDENNNLKLRGYSLNRSLSKLYFVDKFMRKKDLNNVFSAENSNEGVLHILFYLALLISKRTPPFFAVDNIESSLNPHLCTHLMRTICQIANEEQTKQMLITTHNPAILDGLNLYDDNIRLFEVQRNDKGHTVARRIQYKKDIPRPSEGNFKLSELWTRGMFAIDDNF